MAASACIRGINWLQIVLGQIVSDDSALWHGASVHPAERNRHQCSLKRVGQSQQTADRRARYTLLAFNGNAFAVPFSRSAIFFIGEFFGDDLVSHRNSLISCFINLTLIFRSRQYTAPTTPQSSRGGRRPPTITRTVEPCTHCVLPAEWPDVTWPQPSCHNSYEPCSPRMLDVYPSHACPHPQHSTHTNPYLALHVNHNCWS